MMCYSVTVERELAAGWRLKEARLVVDDYEAARRAARQEPEGIEYVDPRFAAMADGARADRPAVRLVAHGGGLFLSSVRSEGEGQ